MAFIALTGTPGSGKTYFAVKHLLDNYYNPDGTRKEKNKNVRIVTNIEGFIYDHVSLDALFDSQSCAFEDRVSSYFNFYERKKELDKIGPTLYIIDEAQEWFPTNLAFKKNCRDIYLFFEKHRHLGASIYLITQDVEKLAKGIRQVLELEKRFTSRSLSVTGEMRYQEYVKGEKTSLKPNIVRPEKRVQNAYKSMELDEVEVVKKPIVKFIAAALVLILMVGTGIIFFYKSWGSDIPTPVYAEKIPRSPTPPGQLSEEKKSTIWKRVDYARLGNTLYIVSPYTDEVIRADIAGIPLKTDGKTIYIQETELTKKTSNFF